MTCDVARERGPHRARMNCSACRSKARDRSMHWQSCSWQLQAGEGGGGLEHIDVIVGMRNRQY